MVLQDRQPRGRLELLFVQGHQVCLGLLDLVVHFLTKFLDSIDLGSLAFVDFNHA